MTTAMMDNIKFTDARANLSPIFDKVIYEQRPVTVNRKNKEVLLIERNLLLENVLQNHCLQVEVVPEDDGSITLAIDELAIYANADTKEAAAQDIISDLKIYADDYLGRLSLYLNSPNRKEHLPYIMRILLSYSDADIMKMLKFSA